MNNKTIQMYYENMNMNDTGVTGSMHHLQIKVQGREDFNIVVDYGQVQSQKLTEEQLYKINSRDVVIQGGGSNLENVDVLFVTHSHA